MIFLAFRFRLIYQIFFSLKQTKSYAISSPGSQAIDLVLELHIHIPGFPACGPLTLNFLVSIIM